MSAPPKETVYARLAEEIASGELEPGAPLVEMTLAARLGVSRTPIREALKRLEQDGVIERHDRGLRVRRRSPEEVLEIYEIRLALEPLAARNAATRRNEIDLVRLRAAQAAMVAADSNDPAEQVSLNRAFHQALWRAGHNATLVDQLLRLTNQIHRYSSTTLSKPGRWADALAEHEALIKAIEDQEPDSAAAIAAAHIDKAREIRLQMVAFET